MQPLRSGLSLVKTYQLHAIALHNHQQLAQSARWPKHVRASENLLSTAWQFVEDRHITNSQISQIVVDSEVFLCLFSTPTDSRCLLQLLYHWALGLGLTMISHITRGNHVILFSRYLKLLLLGSLLVQHSHILYVWYFTTSHNKKQVIMVSTIEKQLCTCVPTYYILHRKWIRNIVLYAHHHYSFLKATKAGKSRQAMPLIGYHLSKEANCFQVQKPNSAGLTSRIGPHHLILLWRWDMCLGPTNHGEIILSSGELLVQNNPKVFAKEWQSLSPTMFRNDNACDQLEEPALTKPAMTHSVFVYLMME